MRHTQYLVGALALAAFYVTPASAEPLVWGIQVEQLEYRVGDDTDVFAWDFDAIAGTDAFRLVWRSEAEYGFEESKFETLENQIRGQVPISRFFDAVAGVRVDGPDVPTRVYGVLGVHGLAPQWFEIDADFFISQYASFRFEVEYELLITNRLILTPSIEFTLPFTDDEETGVGAFGPKLETGIRLSYDVIDRAVSPYIGVHYERVFGRSADFARDEGEGVDALFFVAGVKVLF